MKALGRKDRKKVKILFFEPNGAQFSNTRAEAIVHEFSHIILICGRYEGIDARVKKILKAESCTIGPYVLTGGELPAMVVIDAIARRVKGVLGSDESVEENRISSSEVYTRPEILLWKGKRYEVPKVLLGGNHKEIEAWKQKSNKIEGN
jgi:tRNA (guanine37-N1)-methyltransferase